MSYKDLPLLTDHDRVVANMITDFSNRTGATVHEAHPVAALMQAIGRRIVDNRIILVDGTRDLAVQFGQLIGVTRKIATQSTAVSLWQATDRAVQVPAGTIIRTGGEWDWLTAETALVQQEGNTRIGITAVHPGAAPATSISTVEQVTPLDGVTLVKVVDAVPGEEDEPLGVFLDRLAAEAKIMSLVPRLTSEYAQLIMRDPKVDRALAVAGWDPTTGETGLDRVVGIVVLSATGQALNQRELQQLEAQMMQAGARPANMIVKVANATRVPVTITWEGTAIEGVGSDTAREAGETAIHDLIGVQSWNLDGDQTIRVNDVIGALWAAPEIDHVTNVTINGTARDYTVSTIGAIPAVTVQGTVV